jgi:N-acetyl-anhydromuramyl-L-alanine amidase AmpD
MKKLDLSEINFVGMDQDEYVHQETTKNQIYLHHTAGNPSGVNCIKHWNNDKRGRVATCVVISGVGAKNSKDGEICQGYSSKFWAYHLGVKREVFEGHDVPYKLLDKNSIGVEICNWGYLKKIDDKYYNYVNRVVPNDQVTILSKRFKGHKYWHKYTDAQIESVRQLLVFWNERYGIDITYNECDMWNISKRALRGINGLYTHNSVRSTKSDIYPCPRMIEMLKSL